jgi:hypothetical protein
MTTSKPVELGKATEETKHPGPNEKDNPAEPTGDLSL